MAIEKTRGEKKKLRSHNARPHRRAADKGDHHSRVRDTDHGWDRDRDRDWGDGDEGGSRSGAREGRYDAAFEGHDGRRAVAATQDEVILRHKVIVMQGKGGQGRGLRRRAPSLDDEEGASRAAAWGKAERGDAVRRAGDQDSVSLSSPSLPPSSSSPTLLASISASDMARITHPTLMSPDASTTTVGFGTKGLLLQHAPDFNYSDRRITTSFAPRALMVPPFFGDEMGEERRSHGGGSAPREKGGGGEIPQQQQQQQQQQQWHSTSYDKAAMANAKQQQQQQQQQQGYGDDNGDGDSHFLGSRSGRYWRQDEEDEHGEWDDGGHGEWEDEHISNTRARIRRRQRDVTSSPDSESDRFFGEEEGGAGRSFSDEVEYLFGSNPQLRPASPGESGIQVAAHAAGSGDGEDGEDGENGKGRKDGEDGENGECSDDGGDVSAEDELMSPSRASGHGIRVVDRDGGEQSPQRPISAKVCPTKATPLLPTTASSGLNEEDGDGDNGDHDGRRGVLKFAPSWRELDRGRPISAKRCPTRTRGGNNDWSPPPSAENAERREMKEAGSEEARAGRMGVGASGAGAVGAEGEVGLDEEEGEKSRGRSPDSAFATARGQRGERPMSAKMCRTSTREPPPPHWSPPRYHQDPRNGGDRRRPLSASSGARARNRGAESGYMYSKESRWKRVYIVYALQV